MPLPLKASVRKNSVGKEAAIGKGTMHPPNCPTRLVYARGASLLIALVALAWVCTQGGVDMFPTLCTHV